MRSTQFIVVIFIVLFGIFPKTSYTKNKTPSYMETSMWPDNFQDVPVRITIKNNVEWNDEKEELHDPMYHFNKTMFNLNDKIYLFVMKPILRSYKSLVPLPARTSLSNFVRNITMPVRFVNCLLQGKWNAAQGEMAGFIINTTFGIGGVLNHTNKHPELTPPVEDMGQTLGFYKLGNGFYIVWPILGPSTLRDSIGLIGDWLLNPLTHITGDTNNNIYFSYLGALNDSSLKINQYESIKDAAFDPYEAIRNAYIQNRDSKIAQ